MRTFFISRIGLCLIVVGLLVLGSSVSVFARWSGNGGNGPSAPRAPSPPRGDQSIGGHYVQPHQRTSPNGTQYDNYSSKPNVNPYSGRQGAKTPTK